MRATILFAALIAFPIAAFADDGLPPPPLNGFQAGQDAAARTREEMLGNIGRQIGLNDALRQRAAVAVPALPPGVVPGYPAQSVIGWPGPIGAGFPYGYSPWVADPSLAWRIEIPPWAQVRQPIGWEERQTGPTRWESRPLYAPDAIPAPIPSPPPVVIPAPPMVIPSSPGGVREF